MRILFLTIAAITLLLSSCKEKETTCSNNQELIDGSCQCSYLYYGEYCEQETRAMYYGFYHGEIHDINNDTTINVDSVYIHINDNQVDLLNLDAKIMNEWYENQLKLTLTKQDSGTVQYTSLTNTGEGMFNFFNEDSLFTSLTIAFPSSTLEFKISKY